MSSKNETSSLLRKEISLRQLVILIAFLYSCFIISSLAPSIGRVTPTIALLLYYLLVPGYCTTLLFGENYDPLQRILFSVFISISLAFCLLAVNHITRGLDVPLAISLPVISISIIVYGYYYHKF